MDYLGIENNEKPVFSIINELFTRPEYLKYAEVRKNKLNEWTDSTYIAEIINILNLPNTKEVLTFLNNHIDKIVRKYENCNCENFSNFILSNINEELLRYVITGDETYIFNILEAVFEKLLTEED